MNPCFFYIVILITLKNIFQYFRTPVSVLTASSYPRTSGRGESSSCKNVAHFPCFVSYKVVYIWPPPPHRPPHHLAAKLCTCIRPLNVTDSYTCVVNEH